MGEAIKRALTRRADWFFAYNDRGVRELVALGFPADHITSVQNATDTRQLTEQRRAVSEADVKARRAALGMGDGPVGFFMGGLYDLKRPEFLIDAARAIRCRIPEFELIVVGDGPAAGVVRTAASSEGWIHHVGACFGPERAEFGATADVFLLPGLVGLNVVDGFALELPIVTIDLPFHAPEIEYVVDGRNGIILPAGTDVEDYADAVVALLSDSDRLERMRKECRSSADRLTIEEMARRFADGVVDALALER